MPREILLNKVPVPMPTPVIFNMDAIQALTTDTVVSKDGIYHGIPLVLFSLINSAFFPLSSYIVSVLFAFTSADFLIVLQL